VLLGLIAKCGQFNLAPLDRRKLDDVEKRINGLAPKLHSGAVSAAAFEKLQQICASLAAADIPTALAYHVEMVAGPHGTENQMWLMGLKRLIDMVTKLQVTL